MTTAKVTKDTFWDQAWEALLRGKADRKHPYHTPVFSTLSPTLHPRSRTLVLRKVLRATGELWCYTDRRSRKAADIAEHPGVSWTFWNPRQQLQINASGTATWLAASESEQIFHQLPHHSRKAYATLAPPGQPQAAPTDGLPPNWSKRSLAATDYAAENFGVLVTHLQAIDILRLDRQGHLRLSARRQNDASWLLEWIIP